MSIFTKNKLLGVNEINCFKDTSYRIEFLVGKKYSIYRHVVMWLILVLVFCSANDSPFYAEPYSTYFKIGFVSFLMVFSYINMYWLVPQYLLKNYFTAYLFGILVFVMISVVIIAVFGDFLEDYYAHSNEVIKFVPKPVASTIIGLVFIAASTAIKLFQRWIADSKKISELVKTGMQSELEQLKTQINPHFLFNMLNNANVLIQKDPEKASQVLMTLSDLLRYQLYDSAQSDVLLTSDIRFLSDFLNLEKIRRDHFDYMVSKEGAISGIQVPPFLFITFVENAIKHSLDMENPSFVNIYFEVSQSRLNFVCINSMPKNPSPKSEVGGLGLINVNRRLDLLFKGKYSLKTEASNELYTVNLAIDL